MPPPAANSPLDLLLLGPFPPPFGGVSAHVSGLANGASRAGLRVGVLNHFHGPEPNPPVLGNLRRNPLLYYHGVRSHTATVVHYHHSRWSTLVATALALRNSTAAAVATIHGHELKPYLEAGAPGVGEMTRRALDSFDVLIAVSVEIEAELRRFVRRPIKVLPAYLSVGEEQTGLSPEASAFLRGGVNVLVAAFRLTADARGDTTYGLEIAIQSFVPVALARPEARLAIFLAEGPRSRREAERLHGLLDSIQNEAVRRRVRVLCGEPLVPALRSAAVFLRPTLTDGDAVSIREALAVGVPVLASDVVARPRGTTVVPLEVSRWTTAIENALNTRGRAVAGPATANPLADLLGIYDGLTRRRERESSEPLLP
jgi:glycogen(starch) synthase